MTGTTYTVDAEGKKLGRIATEVAVLLMGKSTPDFARNAIPSVKVSVTNAAKMDVSGKKLRDKEYSSYSGYPGGLRKTSMADTVAKKGYGESLRRAVYRMMPNNRLRPLRMKNLTVTE